MNSSSLMLEFGITSTKDRLEDSSRPNINGTFRLSIRMHHFIRSWVPRCLAAAELFASRCSLNHTSKMGGRMADGNLSNLVWIMSRSSMSVGAFMLIGYHL